MSWEQLKLLASEHRRRRGGEIMHLAQLIVAGQGDSNAWKKKQSQMLNIINSED